MSEGGLVKGGREEVVYDMVLYDKGLRYIFDRHRMYGVERVNCTGDAVNEESNLCSIEVLLGC